MSLSLIPRVRVNYTIIDIFRAFFVDSNGTLRQKCVDIISDVYNGESVCLLSSARDAIYELLIRLPQKKVVIPSYTCMVVNEAVLLSGKEIVFAPSDLDDFNSSYQEYIDGDCIVLATHQYGLPCNIKKVVEKCKKVGAILIEDCATSMGTMVDGQITGTFGDYAVISLNQSKTLTVPPFGGILIGKHGDILRNIEQTAEWRENSLAFKMKGLIKGLAFVISKNVYAYKLMHWLTIDRKGKLQRTEHETTSGVKTEFYKYRFTEWQASILLSQLKKKDEIFKRRKEIYAYYDAHINSPLLIKPVHYKDAVCTRYAVLVNERKAFFNKCVAKGVDMDFSHCSIGCPVEFEREHDIAGKILNLPFYYNMTDQELKKVVSVVNSIK